MTVMKQAALHPQANLNQSSMLFDDFYNYTTTGLWTTVASSSGSTVADDTLGADQLLVTTAASTNDAQGYKSTKSNFLPTSGIGMYAETYFTYANAATNNAAVYFALASSSTFNGNANAKPAASGSYISIYKLNGDTQWRTICCCNGVNAGDTQAGNAICTDGSYTLRIDVVNFDSSYAQIVYKVNGVTLRDSNGLQIVHKLPYASLVKMMILGLCQSGAGGAQTMKVDYTTGGKFRNIQATV